LSDFELKSATNLLLTDKEIFAYFVNPESPSITISTSMSISVLSVNESYGVDIEGVMVTNFTVYPKAVALVINPGILSIPH